MSKNSSLTRWSIAARVLAAVGGGYALAYGFTAFFTVYLPLARPDRVVFASLLCFAVWVAAALYAFAAKSVARLWLLLISLTTVMCLAAFLPSALGARP